MRFFVFTRTEPLPHFCTIRRKQPLHLIRTSMKNLFSALLLLLSVGTLAAQGWERTFGGGGNDGISGMAQTPDGGYIMAGYYNTTRAYLIKADADGKHQWSKFYSTNDFGPRAEARAVVVTRDSGYAVSGYRSFGNDRDVLLFKVNTFGKILWSKSFGTLGRQDEGSGLVELPNGDLVVCGYQTVNTNGDEALFVTRTDAKGNLIWAKNYNPPYFKKRGNAIALAPNGDLVVVGEMQTTISTNNSDAYIVRINAANGDLIWERNFDVAGKNDIARAVVATNDGNFVISGQATSAGGLVEGLLAKIDGTGASNNPIWNEAIPKTNFYGLSQASNGDFFASGGKEIGTLGDLYVARFTSIGGLIWETNIGKASSDEGRPVVATSDGGAVIGGYTEQYFDPFGAPTFAYLVKTGKNGEVFTSYLDCNVFNDFSKNCQQDTLEPNMSGWIVRVESPTFAYRYAVTNSTGRFDIAVDTGTYTLTLFPPNEYWEGCIPTVTAVVPAFYDTVAVPVAVKSKFGAPNNQVDISTPVLRHCADNTYSVRYCNFGTAPSQNTYVDIKFDQALSVKGSSIAGTQLPGTNTYRYQVGALNYGDCGIFSITAALDCDAAVGQTHCAEAHIYPDSFYNVSSQWDGSIIRALATCDNDTVKLSLQNVGFGNLNTLVEYVITEDVIMLTNPDNPPKITDLEPGEEVLVYKAPPSNEGKTLRVIAKQSPGYPGEGYPTAAVEACVANNNPSFSTGYYTMFPEDDADDFIATDCQESTETDFTPTNLKRGHPKGYGEPKYVEPQTDLDFLIQFRNSGPDTVQQVIIRDTLPPQLDPATVRPGAASHAYDFDLYGNGIVQFTLPTANLLPGSSASEGFVRFRIAQREGLPCNTTIRNRAAIYFDFNAPVLTGETFHTVCERDSFLKFISKTKDIAWPGADVVISPNPFGTSTQFEVKGVQADTYALDLFDAQGRKLLTAFHHHPTFRLFRDQLPAGVIYYRLAADGKPVATGKLIVGER